MEDYSSGTGHNNLDHHDSQQMYQDTQDAADMEEDKALQKIEHDMTELLELFVQMNDLVQVLKGYCYC